MIFNLYIGSLQGNKLNNPMFRYIFMGLGIALAVLILIVCGYLLSWAFALGYWATSVVMLILTAYYIALTVPTVWACFSFEVDDSQQPEQSAV